MSVKVGFPNSKYTVSSLNNANNVLVLDSYFDSNVILLNHNLSSTDDVVINFKDKISTGLIHNKYVINSNHTNYISIDENSIELNNNSIVNSNLLVKGLTKIDNGVEVNLTNESNNFFVISCNNLSSIQFKTNNFSIKNYNNNNRIRIDDVNTYISSNIYINGGTLYVDKISSVGSSLTIENATYSSTSIESMSVKNALSIQNTANTPNSIALYLLKKEDDNNIITINSKNFNTNVTKNSLVLNKNGLLGLNTDAPDNFLTINGNNVSNIIRYDGTNYRSGNIYHMTKEANVGIGTRNPKAQLHIKRTDDRTNDYDIRRDPLITLDIDYISTFNTSNVYNNKNTKFSISATEEKFHPVLYEISGDIIVNNTVTPNEYQKTNILYLLNTNMLEMNVINNQITNFNKIQLNQNIIFPMSEISIENNGFASTNVKIINKIYFPKYYNQKEILSYIDGESYNGNVVNITIILYDKNTSLENTNLFITSDIFKYSYNHVMNNNNTYTINYEFRLDTSILDKDINYQVFEAVIVNPPNFLEFSSNNTFKGSLSHKGTLSLGNRSPDTSNYLLYAPGISLINTLHVNTINTEDVNKNISLNGNNISNINNITTTKLNSFDIVSSNMSIFNVYSSNITSSNINVSKLYFNECYNDYLSFSNNEVNVKTKFLIKNESPDALTCCEIKVGNNVLDHSTGVTKNFGLIVQNDTGVNKNPSIAIKTLSKDRTPYINLQNSISEYNIRLITNNVDANELQVFQILDNFDRNYSYFQNDNEVIGFLQHSSYTDSNKYKILSFGEQHIICIDTKNKKEHNQSLSYTNYSSKVSIGLPFANMGGLNNKSFVRYGFKDIIDNSQYLLNIFGNVSISDICKNPILTLKSQEISTSSTQKRIYVGINCEPDNAHTLTVNGGISCKNMTLNDVDVLSAIQSSSSWDAFKAHFI